jgi:prophage antirepressor-like protein
MKKEIKRVSLFNSSMFGNVRTIENENGEAMFCLNDVCKCLGIEKPSNIINDLKKSIINLIECSKSNSLLNKLLPDYQQVADKQHSLLNKLCTENQQVTINDESSFIDEYRKNVISVTTSETKLNFVSESVLYRCIFKSRKKDAMLFQQWIFDEVLPQIRKNGFYQSKEYNDMFDKFQSGFIEAKNNMQKHIDAMKEELEAKEKEIEELRNGVTGIGYMSNIDDEVNNFGNSDDDPFAE